MAKILKMLNMDEQNDGEDEDVLLNLLSNNIDDDEDDKDTNKLQSHGTLKTQEQTKQKVIKESNIDFSLDSSEINGIENCNKLSVSKKPDVPIKLYDEFGDSSDEEDKKYFENQNYTEYGREIKNLLKNKDSEIKTDFRHHNGISNEQNNKSINSLSSTLSSSFQKKVHNVNKTVTQTPVAKNVQSEPFFGFKIIKPLVSSAELSEKMQGKNAVPIGKLKSHLRNTQALSDDWVTAGVIMNQTSPKISAKGHQYCIWKLVDLTMDMKTVSVFLFKTAYKNLWKVSSGSVIAILNPTPFESKDDKDEGTLSVDNSIKVMVLGTSRDLGTCKSRKKNGEPCTMPVNLSYGEHCIYHVKQEYNKFSKRSELKSNGLAPRFGKTNSFEKKHMNNPTFTPRHPQANFVVVPAKKNQEMIRKDSERLALLLGKKKSDNVNSLQPEEKKNKVATELSTNQNKKDMERLDKLKKFNSSLTMETCATKAVANNENSLSSPSFKLGLEKLPTPKLGFGMTGGVIEFSDPVSISPSNKAKLSAIEWAKRNGGFKKSNPNKIRPAKEDLAKKGEKRKREEEDTEEKQQEQEKKTLAKSRFQELLEAKSSHTDLIDQREDEETEKYFKKQECKEKMEEKMLTTFKVDCKAVTCSICKYTAFSSSDLCKKLQHPIKVINAVKRFFKCGDCGNRTISLEKIPTETCKKCAGAKWLRSTMMDEKKTQIITTTLSVRGGEEKFFGSIVGDSNINLCVPE